MLTWNVFVQFMNIEYKRGILSYPICSDFIMGAVAIGQGHFIPSNCILSKKKTNC